MEALSRTRIISSTHVNTLHKLSTKIYYLKPLLHACQTEVLSIANKADLELSLGISKQVRRQGVPENSLHVHYTVLRAFTRHASIRQDLIWGSCNHVAPF